MGHEVEPRAEKDNGFLLEESLRWQERLDHHVEEADRHQKAAEFCRRKLGEPTTLMSSTNIIFVEDGRWQRGNRELS